MLPNTECSEPLIRRDRTAMQRHRCSRPVAMALAEGVIDKTTRVFDYGCGRGDDLRYLKARKFKAAGWDPNHLPKARKTGADVVNLGYVLNVIEDARERMETLRAAYALASKALVVSVRVDKVPDTFSEYADGYLTAKNTFQKIYSQAEFRQYVESVLERPVHVVSLGIGFVFVDAEEEARYLANRAFTRRLEYRTDLIEEFGKNTIAKRYVRLANKLGRIPHAEEFPKYAKLVEAFGSRQRIERLLLRTINPKAFEGSREQRREDILTYFAMIWLQGLKPPKISVLPGSVQRDIRGIWSNYKQAKDEAKSFLFSIGDPERVKAACRGAGMGKLLPTDFYIHRSAEDELPPLLRVLVFAARKIIGNVGYDLLKIALDGRAISFLSYPAFDEDPHPALSESLRVYLPRASYAIREYGASTNPPILHRKDTLVSPNYHRYDVFRDLSVAEEEAGLLSAHDIGRREDWLRVLREKRYAIEDHMLVELDT
ncbi:MAG: DNA phosphorothioation-associated putative methyltransferase [Deltaproteobacteria bacterium]|nr:DNA phosphorothioation-associated putative methyltransferase [Deltaproteobacteria bacterium]